MDAFDQVKVGIPAGALELETVLDTLKELEFPSHRGFAQVDVVIVAIYEIERKQDVTLMSASPDLSAMRRECTDTAKDTPEHAWSVLESYLPILVKHGAPADSHPALKPSSALCAVLRLCFTAGLLTC